MQGKNTILDFDGTYTGMPFKKGTLIYPLIGILAMLIFSRLPMLQAYGPQAGLALGFFILITMLFLSQCFPMEAICLILVSGGFFLGFWDWASFQAASGQSSFLQMICMFVVAMGANSTPIGQRIALIILRKVGNKPIRLVIGYTIATAIISAFISNTATLILMSGIANSMLLTMQEKKGESKLGRCLLLIIPAASYLGGIGLITGSPGSNVAGLNYLSGYTEGKYLLDFRQFATVCFPTMLILLIPFALIYIFAMRLKNTDVNADLPEGYFDELYKEMGSIRFSEIRWLILVGAMVVWLLAGGHGTAVPCIIAAISLLPLVGTTPASKMWSNMPMTVVFMMFSSVMMGRLWTNTGLINFVSDLISPIFSSFSPLVLSIVLTLNSLFLINVLVNAGGAIAMPVTMGIGVSMCLAMGYNPGLVALPPIVSMSMVSAVMLNATSYANFGYGWYEIKDGYLPGGLALAFVGVAMPCLIFLFAGLAGIPVYI